MKRYMKNKNFISEIFYNKVCEKNEKKENKIIALFLILNLCLLPISIEKTNLLSEQNHTKFEGEALNLEEYERLESDYNSEQCIEGIKLWLENVQDENIIDADINNGTGEISVANLEALNKINLYKKIKIKSIRAQGEAYKLEVISQ